ADAMPQIVWAAGPDGQVDYYNRRWYEYAGQPEGFAGDGWQSALHPDDAPRCLEAWTKCVAGGTPFQVEGRFADRAAGDYRWHLGRALPVRDAAGAVTHWF